MSDSYDRFDSFSPLDYRYMPEALQPYLSEKAFTSYKLEAEVALVKAYRDRGQCSDEVVKEIEDACHDVSCFEVYTEEDRTRHDIRALANCISLRVSENAKPFVHLGATSYDIIDSANAARYRDAVTRVIFPQLTHLLSVLIRIVKLEAKTPQIARTHGQHGVPVTFGFALAWSTDRLGQCIFQVREKANRLVGKFSGAAGAYNATSLTLFGADEFERQVLGYLDLAPATISTQIAPPEPLTRLIHELVLSAGVMANIARDMRNLQRTEIDEVREAFHKTQVGSSTMPQKRNPINFENVESMWKVVLGRYQTVLLDQVCEHQRDLTNSASGRTYGEILCYVYLMAERLAKVMEKLVVNREAMRKNLLLNSAVSAEPLYILLARYGHPDAHERVRQLTLKAEETGESFFAVATSEDDLHEYLVKFKEDELEIVKDPTLYTGLAAAKALEVADYWQSELDQFE